MSHPHSIRFVGRTTRRGALARLAGAAAALGGATPLFAAEKTLRVGATFDASGVEKANGQALQLGASAYFRAVNQAGGIHGTKVELVAADDGFKPERAQRNALDFQADASVVALLHPLGTRQTAAVMDAVHDLAVVGPNTGTVGLRKKSGPNVFWVRANYAQEIDKLVSAAATLGIDHIGMVHPDDPLGHSLLAAFDASMAKHRLRRGLVATTPDTVSLEVAPAAQRLAEAAPPLVIMGLAGTAPAFVRALREARGTSTVFGLSIGGSATNIRTLGPLSRGLAFSIVVPSPFVPKHEIVRRYRADLQAAGSTDYSLPSLEGYVNARVLGEALRAAGPAPTRAGVIAALERIEALDLGGLRIDYGRGRREGGHFVDLAVIGAEGRMMA